MKKSIINFLPKSGTNLLVKTLDFVGYTQTGSLSAPLVLQNILGDKGGESIASHEACMLSLSDHLSIPHGKVGDVVKNIFGEGCILSGRGELNHGKKKFLRLYSRISIMSWVMLLNAGDMHCEC